MQKDGALFAFRLANRAEKKSEREPWRVGNSPAVAGCSEIIHMNYREFYPPRGDVGVYC